MSNHVSAIPAVLTVEVDLDPVSQGEQPPEPLDAAAADALCRSVANDLNRVLGGLEQYGLVLIGALYDLTEILRPGLPMVGILQELYRGSLPDARFQPQMMAIGAHGADFPIPVIAPERRPGAGPLLAIPFVLLGDSDRITDLEQRMETELLEKGKASLETGQAVQDHFGIRPLNLSFATFNDLCALLKVQLQHAGFEPLWELLESGLFPGREPTQVRLPEGNRFVAAEGEAFCAFQTFQEWFRNHGEPSGDLSRDFGAFQRLQRQYVAGLGAHGIAVRFVEAPLLPDSDSAEEILRVARTFALPPETDQIDEELLDTGDWQRAERLRLTEHTLPGLGPVAFTGEAQSGDGTVLYASNHYPLVPDAIRRIRAEWQSGAERLDVPLDVIQPGELLFSSDSGQLVSRPEAAGRGH